MSVGLLNASQFFMDKQKKGLKHEKGVFYLTEQKSEDQKKMKKYDKSYRQTCQTSTF